MTYVDSPRGPPATPPEFRGDINGLRALSVALVVFFHIQMRGAGGGFVGVDIFLVISGFLMTKIIVGRLDAGQFTLLGFVRARAARIWPGLAGLVLGLLLAGSLALPPSDLLQIAKQSLWALIFWSNQVFHDHAGYATEGADGNWFLHTWSLSLEWQFYLLYPVLLMLAYQAQRGIDATRLPPRRSIAICIAVLPLLSLGCYLAWSAGSPNSAFFLLPARAWEPLAGAVVFLLGERSWGSHPRSRALLSYAGVGLIVLSALWLGQRHVDPVGLGAWSMAPVLGAMLVIGAASRHNGLLDNRFMQPIGRWSYSIYLWHWPLVVICAMDGILIRHRLLGGALVVAASVLLGWASFRWIELPSHTAGAGGSRRSAAKPVLLLALAAVAAGMVTATGGLGFRMPRAGLPLVKPAAEADYYPANCSNFQKLGRDVRPCVIDKHSDRRVLVIGDSLAEHLYPWFKNHSQVSVDFLTEAECPPVPNFERLQPAFYCLDYARLAWGAATGPHYDTVVISGNWGLVGDVGPDYCHIDGSGSCKTVAAGDRPVLVLAELRRAIQGLLDAGKTVVVLDGTPSTYVNVPQRIERERYWFGAPRFSIPLSSVLAANAWIDPLFAEFQRSPGFHLVSLRPSLCNAVTCTVYDPDSKRAIFIDERHLDPVWMNAHGQVFAPFVGVARPR